MVNSPSYPSARAMITVFANHHEGPRQRMLEFLSTIPMDEFVRPIPSSGGKSLRDILLHIVGANEFWIGLLTRRPHRRFSNDDYETVDSIIPVFDQTHETVRSFLSGADEDWFASEITVTPGGEPMQLVPSLATVHMLTHEYHHKGQIVAIARMLGYEPPDTDLL